MCYPELNARGASVIDSLTVVQAIAVYLIDRPRLSLPETGPLFRWLGKDGDVQGDLENLIGPHDARSVRLLIDNVPGGPAWDELLTGLKAEQFHTVVTHPALLSSAQRQQLIGVCALSGAQLVTPGNAIGATQPVPRSRD
jgi:hypothetical protein